MRKNKKRESNAKDIKKKKKWQLEHFYPHP